MTIINFPVQDAAAETALQAIEQNQPALNGDGGALAHVTNFPQTQPVSATSLPLPTGAAADGTDGTGITPPAGAVGIRGWLSGIYKAVTGTLSISASALPLPTGAAADATLTGGSQKTQVTVLPALPAGANAIGSVSVSNLPATQAVSATALPLPSGAAADGVDATGITAPSGGSGIRGWLSGIYGKLAGTLTVGGTVAVSGTVPVSGTFYQTTQPVSASALPLPSGAATDASLTNGNQKTQVTSLPALPAGANAIGSVSVSNLPATQAVSASALPLPTGAAADATLTNGNQKAQIVPAFTPTANSLAGVCTAAGTDYTALPANAARRFLMFYNTSASASISVSLVGLTTAANAPLIPLAAGQGFILDVAVPNTTVHVQSATAGATYSIVEG
jgi:hypothetical protein